MSATAEITAILGPRDWWAVESAVRLIDGHVQVLAPLWEDASTGSILDDWEERFGDRDWESMTKEEILDLDIDDLRLWIGCVGYLLSTCWATDGTADVSGIMHQIVD